jgi:hypothetical protein
VAIELILNRVNGQGAFVERKVERGEKNPKSGIRNPKQIQIGTTGKWEVGDFHHGFHGFSLMGKRH